MRKASEYMFMGLRVQKDNIALLNWNIDLTFDCNVKCGDCNKLLGILPWSDKNSYLTEEDIRVAAILLRRNFIKVNKISVSGGEPLLNSEIVRITRVIFEELKPSWYRVYTSGTIDKPKDLKSRYVRNIPIEAKAIRHVPFLISPTDLGQPFANSMGKVCRTMTNCGRAFNTYGFSFCPLAPHIGRVLGMDIHKPYPILEGDPEICRHCILSVGRKLHPKLMQSAKNGEFEYPTKTYREGIARERNKPVKYKRFLDKLSEYEKIPKE